MRELIEEESFQDVIGICLPSQSASVKLNEEKKSPQTFAHLENVSAMFDNHTILLI